MALTGIVRSTFPILCKFIYIIILLSFPRRLDIGFELILHNSYYDFILNSGWFV